MDNFCIKKSILKKTLFLVFITLSSFFFLRYLSDYSYKTKAENQGNLVEMQLTPKNYLSKIYSLKKGGSYRLVFSEGLYVLPEYNTNNIPAIKSTEEYVDVPVKGGLLFDQFDEIVIDAKKPSIRPKFKVVHEMGMYFKNVNKVTVSNVNFYGGIPPKKEPNSDLPYDPFRSQLLFRNVKTVAVSNFYLEGVELPENYQTMSAAGVRGITILNDSIEGVAYIHNGSAKNIPWDNILLMGKVTALVYDLTLSRYSKPIYDKIVNYPFSGLVGSAITAFKGAYMNVKRVKIQGFMKIMFLDSSRGASLEEINITIPPDWSKDSQFSGMWLLGVNQTPNSKIRGNLYVNDLSLYPKNVNSNWESMVPTYDTWFSGFDLLQKVELNNIKLGLSFKPGNSGSIDYIYPLFSLKKNDYSKCVTTRTLEVSNWELAMILRWENGGQWKKINYDIDQFKGCGIEISQPVLHKVILPMYPEGNINAFLSDTGLMNKWAVDNNWPW